MKPQRERAREHFPAVLLGVLGIIQALALEILWENGVGGIGRWQAIGAATSGWLQVSAMFLGIIVVWLMYATLVLRYAWVPSFLDLLFPFVLGALEFVLVKQMGPENAAGYFALLAVVFMVSAGGTFVIYRALIRDGVIRIELGTQLLGYVPAALAAVALLACSALTAATGPASTTTAACFGLANAGLLMQTGVFWYYWRKELSE